MKILIISEYGKYIYSFGMVEKDAIKYTASLCIIINKILSSWKSNQTKGAFEN